MMRQPLQFIFLETCDAYFKKSNITEITDWTALTLVWQNVLSQLALKRDHLVTTKSSQHGHNVILPPISASEWIPSECLMTNMELDPRKNTAHDLWLSFVGTDTRHEALTASLQEHRQKRIDILKERIKNPPPL